MVSLLVPLKQPQGYLQRKTYPNGCGRRSSPKFPVRLAQQHDFSALSLSFGTSCCNACKVSFKKPETATPWWLSSFKRAQKVRFETTKVGQHQETMCISGTSWSSRWCEPVTCSYVAQFHQAIKLTSYKLAVGCGYRPKVRTQRHSWNWNRRYERNLHNTYQDIATRVSIKCCFHPPSSNHGNKQTLLKD